MPVYAGTSGFYYPEWVGPFYPEGTSTSSMLEEYARHFDALEINSTYYRQPKAGMFRKYPERTGGRLQIIIKLHSAFTHERNAEKEDSGRFKVAVEPLVESGQFAGYLAQFPQSFHHSLKAREHIEKLRELFPDARIFAEFRHSSWWQRDVLPYLRDQGISMSTVDLPEIAFLPPTGATFTTAPAYLRLHGRNREDWYAGREERYTYRYDIDELESVLERVKKLLRRSETVFVLFNNHPFANAPINAKQLIELIREALPDMLPERVSGPDKEEDQMNLF